MVSSGRLGHSSESREEIIYLRKILFSHWSVLDWLTIKRSRSYAGNCSSRKTTDGHSSDGTKTLLKYRRCVLMAVVNREILISFPRRNNNNIYIYSSTCYNIIFRMRKLLLVMAKSPKNVRESGTTTRISIVDLKGYRQSRLWILFFHRKGKIDSFVLFFTHAIVDME